MGYGKTQIVGRIHNNMEEQSKEIRALCNILCEA
jgi:hypothetical protein